MALAWFAGSRQQPSRLEAASESAVAHDQDASRRAPAEEAAVELRPLESAPSFDVVRIEPTGEGVIAGRSTPGATVRLLRDGRVYDEIVADESGAFAFLLVPLPAGAQQITLDARG